MFLRTPIKLAKSNPVLSAKSNLILIFLQNPELAALWFGNGLQKRNQWVLAKSNLIPDSLYTKEPADLWLGSDFLGTGGYYQKSNTQPTLLKSFMPGMMDGWMDGWQFSDSEMVFKKETDGH